MALITLLRRYGGARGRRTAMTLAALGLFGAALFFGESLTIRGMAPIAEVASLAAIVAGVFMLGRSPLVHCTRGPGAGDSSTGSLRSTFR